MGALFMAGAVALLFYVLREVGAGRALAALLTVAFLTQPHVYESATAGLSEAPFAMFLLASMLAYLRWLKNESSAMLAAAGLMAAGATMSRYEAMFWVMAMAFGIVITLRHSIPFLPYFRGPDDRPREEGGAVSGSLWTFAAPFGFVMAVWMWINIQIKGNPIFFLVGPGSTRTAPDTARVFGEGHPLYSAYHSFGDSLSLAVDQITLLSPLILLATAGLALYALRSRSVEVIAIGVVAWSITAFPVVTAYTGALPPWVRYWYWVVPMGLVLATYGLSRIPLPGLRMLATVAVVGLAFLPNLRVFINAYDAFTIEQPTRAERIRNGLFTTPDLGSVTARQDAVREYRLVAETVEEMIPPRRAGPARRRGARRADPDVRSLPRAVRDHHGQRLHGPVPLQTVGDGGLCAGAVPDLRPLQSLRGAACARRHLGRGTGLDRTGDRDRGSRPLEAVPDAPRRASLSESLRLASRAGAYGVSTGTSRKIGPAKGSK